MLEEHTGNTDIKQSSNSNILFQHSFQANDWLTAYAERSFYIDKYCRHYIHTRQGP